MSASADNFFPSNLDSRNSLKPAREQIFLIEFVFIIEFEEEKKKAFELSANTQNFDHGDSDYRKATAFKSYKRRKVKVINKVCFIFY